LARRITDIIGSFTGAVSLTLTDIADKFDASTGHTHDGTGTDGPPANAGQLQGRDVSASAPSTGQSLAWSGSAWAPATVGGGGGGGSPLIIEEVDGTPSGTPDTLQFPNGTLTDMGGGVYKYTDAGGGGGGGGSSFGQSPFTDPTTPTWAWTNQGSSPAASVDTTVAETIFLHCAQQGAGHNVRMRHKAIPSAPYVATFGFIPHLWNDYHQCGVILRDSGTGKFVFFRIMVAGELRLSACPFNDPSTPASEYTYAPFLPMMFGPMIWLHVEDDNTNRKLYISHDGVFAHAELFHSVGRTDHCTPDQIGFAVNPYNTVYGAGMLLVSYEES
jgi:hypothetical protein